MTNIFTEWKGSMTTYNQWQDTEHQYFLRQFGKLANLLEVGASPEKIMESLNFLDEYITTHFHKEEMEMENYNYPWVERHKNEHQKFINDLFSVKEKLNLETFNFEKVYFYCYNLTRWFYNHIRTEDIEMGTFIFQYK